MFDEERDRKNHGTRKMLICLDIDIYLVIWYK